MITSTHNINIDFLSLKRTPGTRQCDQLRCYAFQNGIAHLRIKKPYESISEPLKDGTHVNVSLWGEGAGRGRSRVRGGAPHRVDQVARPSTLFLAGRPIREQNGYNRTCTSCGTMQQALKRYAMRAPTAGSCMVRRPWAGIWSLWRKSKNATVPVLCSTTQRCLAGDLQNPWKKRDSMGK